MSYIYKSFAIYLCGVEYILVSSAPLGVSQCQTSSPEKHSSHFESIISLFKLSPQPTIQPCMLLITGQVSSKEKVLLRYLRLKGINKRIDLANEMVHNFPTTY